MLPLLSQYGIKQGADISTLPSSKLDSYPTPVQIQYEQYKHYIQLIKKFLQQKISIDFVIIRKNDGGRSTPLILAVQSGIVEIVRELIQHPSVDPNVVVVVTGVEVTALHIAVAQNNIETTKLLLSHPSINVMIRDGNNLRPIDIANQQGYIKIERILDYYMHISNVINCLEEIEVSNHYAVLFTPNIATGTLSAIDQLSNDMITGPGFKR